MTPLIDRVNGDIEQVNKLLTTAFRRKTSGNLDSLDSLPLPEINQLYLIATRKRIPPFSTVVGQFPKGGDGSTVRVLPKYEKEILKYAALYELERSQEVKVILDPKADHGTACF